MVRSGFRAGAPQHPQRSTLAELLEDGRYLEPYDRVPDLPQIPHWTKEEAEEMARRGTRG